MSKIVKNPLLALFSMSAIAFTSGHAVAQDAPIRITHAQVAPTQKKSSDYFFASVEQCVSSNFAKKICTENAAKADQQLAPRYDALTECTTKHGDNCLAVKKYPTIYSTLDPNNLALSINNIALSKVLNNQVAFEPKKAGWVSPSNDPTSVIAVYPTRKSGVVVRGDLSEISIK